MTTEDKLKIVELAGEMVPYLTFLAPEESMKATRIMMQILDIVGKEADHGK